MGTDDNTYPMCTVKNIPRQPEHCIQYAFAIEWQENFDYKMDKDNPDHMQWVCERAIIRAKEFGIKGVDYKLTMGVTKNIIPAVASTNAIVSAACVNETIKILTGCAPLVNMKMQYLGQSRVTCSDIKTDKNPDCFVCTRDPIRETVFKGQTLDAWLDGPKDKDGKPKMDEDENVIKGFKQKKLFKGPTLKSNKTGKMLIGTGLFKKKTEGNLEKTFGQLAEEGLITSGEEWSLIDSSFKSMKTLTITIEDDPDEK